ncbi:MAG: patatin-like phospholipase family protein [bacterium]
MILKKPFVLSGGGARGYAHLGVIQALSERGIVPSAISGTSAGAIIGAFLANGYTVAEIRQRISATFRPSRLPWVEIAKGIYTLKNLDDFLQANLKITRFEDLPIRLHVTATNYNDGRQKIFSSGSIIDAVLAATSIPLLFPPTIIDEVPYVDGGLSNNLPVEPFSHHKGEMVCVHVNPVKNYVATNDPVATLDRTLHLITRGIVHRSVSECFLFVEPPQLSDHGIFDFHQLDEIYAIGYEYANTMDLTPPLPSLSFWERVERILNRS